MKFTCDSCGARYMIPDEKLRPGGVKVRCKKCSHVILVKRAEDPAPAAVAVDGGAPTAASTETGKAPASAAPPAATNAGGAASESLDELLGAAFESMVAGRVDRPAEEAVENTEEPDEAALFGASAQEPEPRREAEAAAQRSSPEKIRSEVQQPQPEPDADADWFLAIRDEQVGPLRIEDLRSRWDRAEIGPDTLCWRAGLMEWTPLSQLTELTSQLAPLPSRTTSRAAAAEAAAGAPATKEPWEGSASKEAAAPAENGWRSTAASALTALVEKEIEAAKTAPQAAPVEEERDETPAIENTGIRVLLRNLPDAPPSEPSRFIPLQRQPEAGASLPIDTAASRTASDAAEKKPRKRVAALAIGGSLIVLVALGAGAWLGGAFSPSDSAPAPAVVAEAPPPAPAAPPPAAPPEPPKPAEAPAAAGPEAGSDAGTVADGAVAEKPAAEEAAATPEVPAKAPDAPAEKPEETRVAKAEAKPSTSPRQIAAKPREVPARRAAPEPPPQEAPRRSSRGSNDLLSAGSSIDDLFEKEFSGKQEPAKSAASGTYIPPAPGSGAALPQQLGQGDITAVVFAQKAELKRCATAYKNSGGASSGTLVMRWSIEPNGRTSGVQPVKGAEHAQLAGCIGDLVKGWRFPAYSGPKMPPIDFPFPF